MNLFLFSRMIFFCNFWNYQQSRTHFIKFNNVQFMLYFLMEVQEFFKKCFSHSYTMQEQCRRRQLVFYDSYNKQKMTLSRCEAVSFFLSLLGYNNIKLVGGKEKFTKVSISIIKEPSNEFVQDQSRTRDVLQYLPPMPGYALKEKLSPDNEETNIFAIFGLQPNCSSRWAANRPKCLVCWIGKSEENKWSSAHWG